MYTGRASSIHNPETGKTYYRVNPETGKNDFEKPIDIPKEAAEQMAVRSKLHSFETVKGEDILESATAPSTVTELNAKGGKS